MGVTSLSVKARRAAEIVALEAKMERMLARELMIWDQTLLAGWARSACVYRRDVRGHSQVIVFTLEGLEECKEAGSGAFA